MQSAEKIQFKDGHYEIPLPFKNDHVLVPNNKHQALARIGWSKKRLEKDHRLCDDYKVFMRDVESDTFTFDMYLKPRPPTRRGILSVVSSVFDPLGFVAPFFLVAKQTLQNLCSIKLGWTKKFRPKTLLVGINGWTISRSFHCFQLTVPCYPRVLVLCSTVNSITSLMSRMLRMDQFLICV